MAELEGILEGPSAVAFVVGDPIAAAKKVVDASKRFPALVLKGGFLDGKVLSADEAKALAELESREVMLAKIAGLVKSDMSRAAAMFVSTQSKFLSLLEAFKEKLQGEAPPDSPPEAAEEEPAAVESAAEEIPAEEAEERPDERSTEGPEQGSEERKE
jgi:large subunit ribosomal protein L10